MKYYHFRMTKEQAMALGLLTCTCGHPENNHFEHGKRPCAHCECEKYIEVARESAGIRIKESYDC